MTVRIPIWVTLLTLAMATMTQGGMPFDDPASLKAWTVTEGREFPGANGKIAWDGRTGHRKQGGLALHYDFTGGGSYVGAIGPLPKHNDARVLHLWLNKPGDHRITIRCVDSSGQAFQKSTRYTLADWQEIEVDLTRWTHWFGGPADGNVRFPIQRFAVLIENNGAGKQGVLHIDDVTWSADHQAGGGTSTYVASDFSGSPHWRFSGGSGNHLKDRVWTYQFNGKDRPTLHTELGLLGRPTAMRLVLESDGSGHAVEVELASHFQRFKREIGRLDRKGELTLETELGRLEGWEHYRGPNDGVVRYPLRLKQIVLRREGKRGEGKLRLKRLEVDLAYTARDAVVMIPDVSQEGQQVRFTVQLQNLRDEDSNGRLVCEVRSLDGMIGRKVAEVTLPGGVQTISRSFTFQLAGHHMADAEFRWIEPGLSIPPVSVGMSTLPKEIRSTTLDHSTPMGMGIYLNRWRWDHRRKEMMHRLADLARRAGVDWTREEFNWATIEREEGKYDWTFHDELVETAERHGISVCALLCYWSGWAEQNTQKGIDQYCSWVRQVVRRYKGRIQHWEIWNEPNIFFWTGPRELYADLLTQAYETIKKEDPNAVVIGCSTSGIDKKFIELTLENGGKFDALSIHPYRGVLQDPAYMEELREVRRLVGDRPIWITEIGYPSQLLTGYSERRQASLLARTYILSLASRAVDYIAWYNFRNDGNERFEAEQNFGVVRSDLRPKPAYRALATVGRTLDGLTFKEQIDVGDDSYAFRFSDEIRNTVVVCSPRAGRLMTFDSAASIQIVNGVSEAINPVRQGNRYTVTLDAGFPIYVSGRAGFPFKSCEPMVRARLERTSVRAGGSVELAFSPTMDVQRWEMPFGWDRPERIGSGTYRLTAPSDSPTGRVELQAYVRLGQSLLRVPITLSVTSAKIRI